MTLLLLARFAVAYLIGFGVGGLNLWVLKHGGLVILQILISISAALFAGCTVVGEGLLFAFDLPLIPLDPYYLLIFTIAAGMASQAVLAFWLDERETAKRFGQR